MASGVKFVQGKVVALHLMGTPGQPGGAMKLLIRTGFQLEGLIKRGMGATQQAQGTGRGRVRDKAPSAPGDFPHVQTGRLRASISTDWVGSGRGASTDAVEPPTQNGVVRVGTSVEYALALEFGFEQRNLAARPFLRPSMDKLVSVI